VEEGSRFITTDGEMAAPREGGMRVKEPPFTYMPYIILSFSISFYVSIAYPYFILLSFFTYPIYFYPIFLSF